MQDCLNDSCRPIKVSSQGTGAKLLNRNTRWSPVMTEASRRLGIRPEVTKFYRKTAAKIRSGIVNPLVPDEARIGEIWGQMPIATGCVKMFEA